VRLNGDVLSLNRGRIHPVKKGPLFLCPNIGAITGILLTRML
jgi:hypothetical protein